MSIRNFTNAYVISIYVPEVLKTGSTRVLSFSRSEAICKVHMHLRAKVVLFFLSALVPFLHFL